MRLTLLFFLLLCSSLVYATTASVRFKQLNIEQGLSQNTIQSILQDKNGFIWLATSDGLNRFDGYNFKIYRHNSEKKTSIAANNILSLHQDKVGSFWIGTDNGGLNQFIASTESFINYSHSSSNPNSLSNNHVNVIFTDSQQQLWIGTENGLNQFNQQKNQFIHHLQNEKNPHSISDNNIKAIYEDSMGILWIGTEGGLNSYNPTNGRFTAYTYLVSDPESLSHNSVTSIVEDQSSYLWVATNGGGLNRFDKSTGSFKRFTHQDNNINSLNDDRINTLFIDHKQNLWIGTKNGLNQFNPKTEHFELFINQKADPDSLSNNDVQSIMQDSNDTLWFGTFSGGVNFFDELDIQFNHFKADTSQSNNLNNNVISAFNETQDGKIWIGTVGGGINIYDNQLQEFSTPLVETNNPQSLSHDRIFSILNDYQNTLWVGTWGGGINRYLGNNQFEHFVNDPSNPKSLSNNNVISILEDSNKTLWFGTWGGGLNQFDSNTKTFKHYKNETNSNLSLSNDVVWTLYQDKQENIWVGTYGGGLNRFNPVTNSFERFVHSDFNAASLSDDSVFSLLEDSKGQLWIGTNGGLNKFIPENKTFKHFREKDGLANDTIYGILEDDSGYLWLSSNKGLTQFDPIKETFKNYNVNDGLQSNEFNANAFFKNSKGELFFGGINGFNRFYPKDIKDNTKTPLIALTDFLLFNQSVEIKDPNNNKNSNAFYINKAINELEHLTLSYKENLMTFEFAALHYSDSQNNQYAYKLEGWDNNWIPTDAKNRRATFTNIPAGNYTLRIKASNSDGYWNDKGKSLKITILAAPWLTWWAYSFYTISLLLIVILFIHHERQKHKKEHAINIRLKEVDKLKNEFLANTSHELRTPLNGIIGLSELLQLEPENIAEEESQESLKAINQCGKQLKFIVDDLLDFSLLQSQKYQLNFEVFNIVEIIVLEKRLFLPIIQNKQIKIDIHPDNQPIEVYADQNRIHQVIHNLLNNAVKFSDQGEIKISITIEQGDVNVSIKDSGIGIAKELQENIFLPFTQIDQSNTRARGGIGLGLAICKDIIELHGSHLELKSEIGHGSEFSFKLKLAKKQTTKSYL